MKNKKILFLFVAVIVLCLSTALFAACNKNDTPPSSKGDFKEGDVIVDKNENTVTEKEYDEAGREVREISHVETLYNVTYLANDASVIYLKGNKSDEMYVSGYDGVPKTLSVKDLESKISLDGNAIVVKGVTESAFMGCETLTSVDLEKEKTNTLTFAIGEGAFANCPNLATVTLPTKVYMKSGSIGEAAFYNCESLTKVVIPDRFKTLGEYAFANCLKLETVTFNEGVAKVPQGFLYGCESLTSVTIPSTVNYVGNQAFSGCKKLTTITFPDSVTYVGDQALADCIALQSVKIPFIGNSYNPDSSTTLANLFGTHDLIDSDTEESYFYQIPAISGSRVRYIPSTLTSVEVTNATSLPAYAFAGLESLTSLSVTYSTADRIRVYDADTNYSNYDIPEITAVSAYAFAGLGHISDFPIPEKATAIGECAFTATGLTDAALVGILMKTQTIDDGAFADLPNVTSVAIPQNVLSVGMNAFARNANLKSFLSTAKTALSRSILKDCRSLETVTVPYIGTSYVDVDANDRNFVAPYGNAFANIFSTDYPSDMYNPSDEYNLDPYYYSANGYYVPETLNTITVTSEISIPQNAFRGILASNISVAFNGDMLSDIDFEGVMIGSYAFYGCENLTSFAIDANYSAIGSYAFANSGLTSVTIPSTIYSLASNAFNGCTDLTSLTWNTTQISVPDFSWSNISTLTLGENVVNIPSNAFRNVTTLTNVYVNAPALESIGNGAFANTAWLDNKIGAVYLGKILYTFNGVSSYDSFIVEDGTVAIESYALQNRSNIDDVYIPASVTRIGSYAFDGCSNLDIVLYEGTQEQYANISMGSNSGLSDAKVIFNYVNNGSNLYQFYSNGEILANYTTMARYIENLPTPSEIPDYVFYGWYENEDFSGEPVSAPYWSRNGATLYARWLTQNEYNELMDGSSFEKAIIVRSNQTYDVNITTIGQRVYFRFVPPTSGSYSITASNSSGDNYGYLYNSSRKELTHDDDSAGGRNFKITYTMTAGETYYIGAAMLNDNSTGSFKITITMN